MDYCGERGIPYEVWLEWGDLSRDASLAWQARRNARCGSCGQVKADWTDEEGREVHPPPIRVTEHWCPGCEALARRRKNVGEPADGFHLGFAAADAEPEPDSDGEG